jgi:tRNA-dihydrouridine synthase
MIGRMAPANPWIFRQIEQYTESSRYHEPAEADRYQMIRTYFQMLIGEELPDAQGKMKQFASWFTHGVPGGAALRKAIYEAKSAPEILQRVEEFFEQRSDGPAVAADAAAVSARDGEPLSVGSGAGGSLG